MKKILYLLIGLALGFALGSPAAQAIEGILAQRCTSPILLNGAPVEIEAYNINGHNYFKLRDIGKAVGFNVYWIAEDRTVRIETNRPYTGEAPAKVETDKPVPQPEVTAPAADVDAAMRPAGADVARLRVGHLGHAHERVRGAVARIAAGQRIADQTGTVKAVRADLIESLQQENEQQFRTPIENWLGSMSVSSVLGKKYCSTTTPKPIVLQGAAKPYLSL